MPKNPINKPQIAMKSIHQLRNLPLVRAASGITNICISHKYNGALPTIDFQTLSVSHNNHIILMINTKSIAIPLPKRVQNWAFSLFLNFLPNKNAAHKKMVKATDTEKM